MSTYITLEDGRTMQLSNGVFDGVLEAAVSELQNRDDALDGLAEWVLEQRCRVQGPGVGYVDTRELSPRAAVDFRWACQTALDVVQAAGTEPAWLWDSLALLHKMWASIDRGEPPETLTSPYWRLDVGLPYGFEPRGPGWTEAELRAWHDRYPDARVTVDNAGPEA